MASQKSLPRYTLAILQEEFLTLELTDNGESMLVAERTWRYSRDSVVNFGFRSVSVVKYAA